MVIKNYTQHIHPYRSHTNKYQSKKCEIWINQTGLYDHQMISCTRKTKTKKTGDHEQISLRP